MPIFGPSGAKSALQDSANASRKRAAAVLAVGVVDEAAADVHPVGDFEVVVERDHPLLQGGGGRDHLEGRARAAGGRRRPGRRAPARRRCGRRARRSRRSARPGPRPRLPAVRGRSSSSPARRASACPWRGSRAEPPSSGTASSEPPGLPARRALKACSRPLTPTGVSAEKPCRASAGRSSSSAVPTSPVTSIAALPSGCSRASASPFGQRRAVGGEDRGPGRQFDFASRGARRRRSPGKTRLGSQAMPPSS